MFNTRSSDEGEVHIVGFEDLNSLEGEAYRFAKQYYDERYTCSECLEEDKDSTFVVGENGSGDMMAYSHPQGLKNGDNGSYWFYIQCPECDYQHSFEKVIDEDSSSEKIK